MRFMGFTIMQCYELLQGCEDNWRPSIRKRQRVSSSPCNPSTTIPTSTGESQEASRAHGASNIPQPSSGGDRISRTTGEAAKSQSRQQYEQQHIAHRAEMEHGGQCKEAGTAMPSHHAGTAMPYYQQAHQSPYATVELFSDAMVNVLASMGVYYDDLVALGRHVRQLACAAGSKQLKPGSTGNKQIVSLPSQGSVHPPLSLQI